MERAAVRVRAAVLPLLVLCAMGVAPLGVRAAGTAASSTEDWTHVGSYEPPIVRGDVAMAFDPATGQTVLFGGSGPSPLAPFGDTWTFDGSRWTLQQPAHSPSPRLGAAMAYDAADQEIVLFGGFGRTAPLSDTWTWDGSDWTERAPAHVPPARYLSGMAYDSASGDAVLFGGDQSMTVPAPNAPPVAAQILLGDTWTWNGSDWTQQLGIGPPPRYGPGFADGSATSPPVLFGGEANGLTGSVELDDTWTWNGAADSWTPQIATGPHARAGASLAYDTRLGEAVLFGGYASDPSVQGAPSPIPDCGFIGFGACAFDDTWAWTGSNWTQLGPPSTQFDSTITPYPRSFHGAAYDSIRGRVQIFGGSEGDPNIPGGGRGTGNDTWGFDGHSWTQVDLNAPDEMQNAMLAREPGNASGAVMFGGQDEYGGYLQTTWRWTGAGWQSLTPAHMPPPRGMGAMVFDPDTNSTLLFGGNVDTLYLPGTRQIYSASDTWSWDGTDWTQLHPATAPAGRYYMSAVYDAVLHEVVLFGGTSLGSDQLNDTWTWDGTTWTQQHPVHAPPGRFGYEMAYDAATQEVVLFGGSEASSRGYYDDTWMWDGSDWTQQNPAHSPRALAYASMTYDPQSQSVVLLGGCAPSCFANPIYDDTWSWNGSDWTQLSPAHPAYPATSDGPAGVTNAVGLDGSGTSPLLVFGGRRPVQNPVPGGYDLGTEFVNDVWAFGVPVAPPNGVPDTPWTPALIGISACVFAIIRRFSARPRRRA